MGRCGLALLALAAAWPAWADGPKVGSKRFTESYILGELLARTAGGEHRPGLGNTAIVFAALKSGSIDLYPEYTGTLAKEILKLDAGADLATLNRALARDGLGVGIPLGFNNGYALAAGEASSVRRISDLAQQPALRLGLSQEFLGRSDGWPGLKAAYSLPQQPTGLDHGLAYEALAAGRIDVMDVYTTDAKIGRYRLRVLEDDRKYFPRYDAVLVYRLDAPQRFPKAFEALKALEGRIDERAVMRMNAAAELDGRSFRDAAGMFFGEEGKKRDFLGTLFGADFWRLTGQHFYLVAISLLASIAVGVPLGVTAAKWPRAAPLLLGGTGLVQTIPALALFAFLIALVGTIGTLPALIALFLYALLPIVQNTHAGLVHSARGPVRAAMALGLTPGQVLALVELPLALPSILAGVKTSAVINVGTATIAAFIGAGGYGERIASGLALNDNVMLLAGAIPAAALALLVQAVFALIERRIRWLAGTR